jgi:hypothetical protein
MSLWGALCWIAALASMVYGIRQVCGLLSAKWDADRSAHVSAQADRLNEEMTARLVAQGFERRRVAVLEREIALKEQQTEKPAKPAAMPDDLRSRIDAWDEEFAQENERQTLYALFSEYGDWDEVRKKLAPLTPVIAEEIASPRDGMLQ